MSRPRYAAVVCCCVMVAFAIPGAAQSLAEVARKEEARRKTIPEPAKVYTNKDLKPVPAPSSSHAPSPPGGKTDKGARDKNDSATPSDRSGDADTGDRTDRAEPVPPPRAEPARDGAYWAGRVKAAQEQLARDETYAAAMQSRINALTTDFVNRDDPAQKRVIEQDRLKAIAEMERLERAIANDKKAFDGLLEEARRAGVPPGWLR